LEKIGCAAALSTELTAEILLSVACGETEAQDITAKSVLTKITAEIILFRIIAFFLWYNTNSDYTR